MRIGSSVRPKAVLALPLLAALLLLPSAEAFAIDTSGLTRLDGTEVSPGDLPDNAIIIAFATWSPRCRKIVARSNAIQNRWGGVAPVFLVNFQEDAAVVEEFFGDDPPSAEVLLDRRAAFSKAHSITSLPGVLAVKDGRPAFRGKLPADIDSVLRPIYE